jgi:hypothetical protein
MTMKPQDLIPPPDLSYAERVVGFIDILGFADLVQLADRDQGLRNQIIEALGEVESATAPVPLSGESDLKAQNFSDSLPVGLWHLLGATWS